MNNIILDIETMSTKPNAVICSIGAVVFDLETGGVFRGNGFYQECDWYSQQGRDFDPETIKWWAEQDIPPPIGNMHLRDALIAFSTWFTAQGLLPVVWGNGPTFDVTIVENAMVQYQVPIPWKFWNIRDVRTIVDIAKPIVGKNDVPFIGNKHNALDDACHEAVMVCKMYEGIRSCKW